MNSTLVRASALQGYRETVLALGGDPERLMARHGLATTGLDPEDWVSYPSFLRLLEDTAHATNCPTFGLRLSTVQDINILGVVGFTVQQAPDVRSAVRELNHYFNHVTQGAVASNIVEGGVSQWSFTPKPLLAAPILQQSDLVAGVAIKVMHTLVADWEPIAIYLPHSAPADTRPYRKIFKCPIYFDWDTTIVASDAAFLELSLQQANPQLHRLLESHLNVLREHLPEELPGQVSYLIKEALMSGDCSIERVSKVIAVNKRTLQRKLKSQGTSYQELLDEVRFNVACNYLRESTGSLASLAHLLCYSKLSAFSSAFRNRFGLSPRAWRQQQLTNQDS